MKRFSIKIMLVLCWVFALSGVSGADELIAKYSAEYPAELYLLGLAEVRQKGSDFVAFRVAEVHAKRDIAHQIKERVESTSVDYACSNATTGKSFSESECRDEFLSVIQVTADEYLSGARVVDKGKRDGNVYVVVVMPKVEMADQLRARMKETVKEARDLAAEAKKSGDEDKKDEARRATVKAKAVKSQLETFEKIDRNAKDAFKELDSEIEAF